ncbi:hypothetical protein [Streptomyces syringium]|uniref:hypothetical protein n=1 Tax=Streptomyces syringium TaxID=76729 RepID=UPI0037D72248
MDLHAWITQQVDKAAEAARAAPDGAEPALVVSAAAVLRRCVADRRVLARHNVDPGRADSYEATACAGCGTYGDCDWPETENVNDCPELHDLAYAYGISDETLAGLDRPQPPQPTPTQRRRRNQLAKERLSLTPPITTRDVPAALRGPR